MDFPKNVVIIGAGGFGREVAETVRDIYLNDQSLNLLGFLDEDGSKHGTSLNGVKILGGLDYCYKNGYKPHYVCAIGDPWTKRKVIEKVEQYGYTPISLIHPDVHRFYGVNVGRGVIVQAGTKLSVNTTLEDHVHVNLNCVIGHDAKIGKYSTISPLCGIEGFTTLKEGVFVGSNASVIPGVTIGEYCTIGAQAAVIRNCQANRTYVGVPARCIK